ncbi:MAG: hypothetical protein KDA59_21930, partial [Planctomycetales bacterium]|nr:hypothetical protein [Planctomycetales bacterium]
MLATRKSGYSVMTTGLVLALATLSSGCATWKAPSLKMPWSNSEEELAESKYEQPARMAVIWTDSVLTTPGKQPTRGFGGRIYFFNAKNQAIPVEGQLVIYGYDDTDKKKGNRPPDRRFVFSPEQFTQHFSETEIGASYSVWVPWDHVGGEERQISLLPVFASTGGHKVVGNQT